MTGITLQVAADHLFSMNDILYWVGAAISVISLATMIILPLRKMLNKFNAELKTSHEFIRQQSELNAEYQALILESKQDRQQETQLKQLQSTANAIRENLDVMSKQILKSDISAEDYAELISIYDEWREDTWYKAGQIIRWKDKAYEVVAPEHYSVISQEPDVTPAVYKEFTPPEIGDQEIIEDWEKPLYAEVGYDTGDIVRHKGQLWISTMDKNPHEPGVYGWDIYED